MGTREDEAPDPWGPRGATLHGARVRSSTVTALCLHPGFSATHSGFSKQLGDEFSKSYFNLYETFETFNKDRLLEKMERKIDILKVSPRFYVFIITLKRHKITVSNACCNVQQSALRFRVSLRGPLGSVHTGAGVATLFQGTEGGCGPGLGHTPRGPSIWFGLSWASDEGQAFTYSTQVLSQIHGLWPLRPPQARAHGSTLHARGPLPLSELCVPASLCSRDVHFL